MQSCWLTKKNRSSCILFLAGWGMDPFPFRSIPVNSHDLVMIYDYRQIDPVDILQQVNPYSSVHLLAWSMGVWIAGRYFSEDQGLFSSSTAINGTLQPIEDQMGIPPKPFDDMIQHFSSHILETFYRDMFDEPDQAGRFLRTRPERSLDSIRSELETLRNKYTQLGPGKNIFSKKIVGSRDRIFPARSQLRSWGKENCSKIQSGHFPFYDYPSWDMIIDGGMPG